MIKAGRRTVKRAPQPAWISDTSNQIKWNVRFAEILKRDYGKSDATISAILSDALLAQRCATDIRSYVDKGITLWLYEQRKARGVKHKRKLEIAIAGLNAAMDLCTERGDQESVLRLRTLADKFSQERMRCKEAFATKRHGRDRDLSILSQCRSFLEKELGRSVTSATLANLVNAGYETDGNLLQEPITEENIRKNLANFKHNNPCWRNDIDPRYMPVVDPATK